MKVVVSTIAYSVRPEWQWKLLRYLGQNFPGFIVYSLRKRLYDAADALICGSQAEAAQLVRHFSTNRDKIWVIPHGVDRRFYYSSPDLFVERYGFKDFVLTVGRIGNRKGQARLIRALKGTGLRVVVIGEPQPDDPLGVHHFQQVLSENRNWVTWLRAISHDDPLLASAYAAARVHALPSLGDFGALVNLEAGLAGCSLVCSRDPHTLEYLGDDAYWCDPLSEISIRNAVLTAFSVPRSANNDLRRRLLERFTWESVADQVAKVYETVLVSKNNRPVNGHKE